MERMDKAEEDIEKLKQGSGGSKVGKSQLLLSDLSAYVKQSDFDLVVKKKVDTSIFNAEIDALKGLINALGAKGGEKVIVPTGPSAAEMQLLKEAAEKVKELEKRVILLEQNKADKSELQDLTR
jgi:hypothetical protein